MTSIKASRFKYLFVQSVSKKVHFFWCGEKRISQNHPSFPQPWLGFTNSIICQKENGSMFWPQREFSRQDSLIFNFLSWTLFGIWRKEWEIFASPKQSLFLLGVFFGAGIGFGIGVDGKSGHPSVSIQKFFMKNSTQINWNSKNSIQFSKIFNLRISVRFCPKIFRHGGNSYGLIGI